MEALDKKAPSTIIERSEDDKLKSEWTKMFLEGNGFQYVLKIFMEKNLKKQADGDTPSTADWFDLKHFAFLLKLLRIFIMAAFSTSSESAIYAAASLVRRSSSIDESVDKVIEQPAHEGSRFKQLQSLLEGPLGQDILNKIDYKALL